jgi:hypothetical protein
MIKNPGTSSESMDARRMRAHNSAHVLKVVKKLGAVSRADITRRTRLSPPTCLGAGHESAARRVAGRTWRGHFERRS